jgi:hypothetical protein
MSYATDNPVTCQKCPNNHPGSKWHTIRAADAGWYHTKDGQAFCPNHRPRWAGKQVTVGLRGNSNPQAEDEQPGSEVALITDPKLIAQFAEMVTMIPSEDGSGTENILRQLLAAKTWEDLSKPWETSDVDDLRGLTLRVTKVTRRPSRKAGGLGMFLVVHMTDTKTGKDYVKATGSINVIGSLVAAYANHWMPLTVEWHKATEASDNGFFPQHLRIVDGVTPMQGNVS